MRIAFIHPHKAFLPEIDGYIEFFNTYGIETQVLKPKEHSARDVDVEWHFMGMDRSGYKEGVIKIHEYTSASIQPFRKWKDFAKRWVNAKPAFRLFLNEYVRSALGFSDK